MLAALLSLFFAGAGALGGAVGMAALLGLSLAMTLGVSFLLSKTALKGLSSFFALELPPYRRPQVGQVLVRSVLDRTCLLYTSHSPSWEKPWLNSWEGALAPTMVSQRMASSSSAITGKAVHRPVNSRSSFLSRGL